MKKLSFQLLLIAALSFSIYWNLTREVFFYAVVEGASMEPTYHNLDGVMVNKIPIWRGNLHRGDVVVAEFNDLPKGDRLVIKRIGAVGGDKITNGTSLTIIPKNEYYLLGDNAAVSYDSRFYGPVKRSQIVGVVLK